MKKTPVVAVAIVLALSTQACTVTPKASVMSSSAKSPHPAVVVKHPVYQPAVDGPPPVYRANVSPVTVDSGEDVESTGEDAAVTTRDQVIGILGQIVVACATSGNCW